MDASCENEDGEEMRHSLIFHGSYTLWIFIWAGRNEWGLLHRAFNDCLFVNISHHYSYHNCYSDYYYYIFYFFSMLPFYFLQTFPLDRKAFLKKILCTVCTVCCFFNLYFVYLMENANLQDDLSIYLSFLKPRGGMRILTPTTDGPQIECGGSLLGRCNAVLSDQIGLPGPLTSGAKLLDYIRKTCREKPVIEDKIEYQLLGGSS